VKILEPEGQGDLGADDRKFDLFTRGQCDDGGHILSRDREAGSFQCDAAVARSSDDPGAGRGGEAGFDQGMFASAGADDEDSSGKAHSEKRK
jgi:hypothetical protein